MVRKKIFRQTMTYFMQGCQVLVGFADGLVFFGILDMAYITYLYQINTGVIDFCGILKKTINSGIDKIKE